MNFKFTSAQKGMAALVCALTLAPNLASAQTKIGDNPTQKVPGARLQVDGDATTTTPAKLIVTGTGNTGIGTAAPATTLDVNGAITNRETTVAVATNAATIPANVSQVQLTGAATANVVVTAPAAPNAGQRLIVYNNTTGGFAATLNSIAVPAGQAMEFIYSNGGWRSTNGGAIAANLIWGINGNIGSNAGTNFIGTADNTDFVTRTNNTEKLRVTASGNVGIGTATPGQTLSVSDPNTGSVATASILQPNLGVGSGNYLKLGKVLATNDAADIAFFYQGIGSVNNYLSLGFSGNSTPAAAFMANGNVGFGTATPHAPLHVANSNNAGGMRKIILFEDNDDENQYYGFGIGNSILRYQVGNYYSSHVFYTGAGPNSSYELMRIKGNGNVGIGTDSPDQRLSVSDPNNTGSAAIASFLFPNLGVSSGNYLKLGKAQAINDAADIAFIYQGPGSVNNYLSLGFSGNSTAVAVFKANGNVGIGTTAPDQALSVNGNASKSAGGTAWAVFSDKRLKKDIHPFTDGLRQVMQIKPVFFKYNGKGGLNPSEKDEIGIIAQEMQQIAPYAVTQTDRKIDESGKGALQFDRAESVTYMLVNAVKEQQAMIEKQQQEMEKQQQLIAKQQQQIEKMNEQNTRLTAEVEVIKKEVSTGKYSVK